MLLLLSTSSDHFSNQYQYKRVESSKGALYHSPFTSTCTDSYRQIAENYLISFCSAFVPGASPYPGMNSQEVINFLRDGYRMDKPKHCSEEL